MRSINPAGIAIVKEHEGCRLVAYPDPGSELYKACVSKHLSPYDGGYRALPAWEELSGAPWTIAWGHTHHVKAGDKCSQTQADQWLGEDLASAENAVEHIVHVPLSENQFSALVSFAENVGFARFARSTLATRLNNDDYESVPNYLKAWVFAGGKKQPGLVARRAAEGRLWSKP